MSPRRSPYVRWANEEAVRLREKRWSERLKAQSDLDVERRAGMPGATFRKVTPKREVPAPRWSVADRQARERESPAEQMNRQAWGIKPKKQKQKPVAVVYPPSYDAWQEHHGGSPLGVGMPSGSPLREDGESHSDAWRRLLREDPCAYCDEPESGTVDHIEPRSKGRPFRERWTNLIGACSRCNRQKAATPMLLWMLDRAKREDAQLRRAARSA